MSIRDHHLGVRTVRPEQLTKTAKKVAVTEASTLGWAPGFFAYAIDLEKDDGRRFRFERIRLAGEGARYRHPDSGTIIVVLND